MREIKFRFTFKNGNFIATRYATLDELLDDSFPIEKMEEDINCDSGINDIEDFPEYQVFKDQYTGLKDQKDIDIYENDIVEVQVHRPKNKEDYEPFKTKQLWTVEHVDHLTHTGFEFYGDDRRFHTSISKSKIFNNKVVVVSTIHKENK